MLKPQSAHGSSMEATSSQKHINRILLSKEEIQGRVRELATALESDYAGKNPLLVGILKGAFLFLSDLVREMDIDLELDFMATSSYGASTESSGVVRILKDLDETVEDRHVLIVEDIVDTGLTLNYLAGLLRERNPASLQVCVLLDKPERRKVPVKVHYTGFTIPDEFVVGYGLDFAEQYRNLPHVAVLNEDVT